MKIDHIYAFILLISAGVIMQASEEPDPNSYPDKHWQLYTHKQLNEQDQAWSLLKKAGASNNNARISEWPVIKDRWPRQTTAEWSEFNRIMVEINTLWARMQDPQDGGNCKALAKQIWDQLHPICQLACK